MLEAEKICRYKYSKVAKHNKEREHWQFSPRVWHHIKIIDNECGNLDKRTNEREQRDSPVSSQRHAITLWQRQRANVPSRPGAGLELVWCGVHNRTHTPVDDGGKCGESRSFTSGSMWRWAADADSGYSSCARCALRRSFSCLGRYAYVVVFVRDHCCLDDPHAGMGRRLFFFVSLLNGDEAVSNGSLSQRVTASYSFFCELRVKNLSPIHFLTG